MKEKIVFLIIAAVLLILTFVSLVVKNSKLLGIIFIVELVVFAAVYLLSSGVLREFYLKVFSIEARFFSSKFTEVGEEKLRILASKLAIRTKKEELSLSQPIDTDAERQGLVVTPRWSIDEVNADSRTGHIIFEVKNHTGKKVLIAGYRMFRVSPNGKKDYYWRGKIAETDDFKKWVSSSHFQITLMDGDEHTYHWNDVDIVNEYGIEYPGKWETEVHIVYIEEGNSNIMTSFGSTNILYSN